VCKQQKRRVSDGGGDPRGRRAGGCHIWSFDTNKAVGFINKNVTRLFLVFRPARAARGVPYTKKIWKNETITFVFSETFTLCARVCNVIVIIIIIITIVSYNIIVGRKMFYIVYFGGHEGGDLFQNEASTK